MSKGIRQRLLYSYLSLTLVIMVLLSVALIYKEQKSLTAGAITSLSETSALRADIVALRIRQEINKLEYLSNTVTAKALNGTEILALLRNMVADTENQLMVNGLYGNPEGLITSLHNETGNISKMPYFIQLIDENLDHIVSEPMISLGDKAPSVVILASIRDPLGKVTGVIGSAIDLGRFSGTLTNSNYHQSAFSWIVSADGTVIAHPSEIDLTALGFEKDKLPEFNGIETLNNAVLGLPSGTFKFKDPTHGDTKLGVYTDIPGTNGWKLCTAISLKVIYAPLLFKIILLIGASAILITFVYTLSNKISKSITDPLELIAFSADNLARGNHRPIEVPQEPHEINHLVRSFNHMANVLTENTEALEKLIAEKDKTVANITGRIHDRNDRISQIHAGFVDVNTRDKITHLLTRNVFLRQLEQIKIEVDTGVAESFSLLCMAIDSLDKISDALGNEAADLIVQRTARMITSTVRSSDIASRYDRDIFMIVLSGTNQIRANAVIKKLTQTFNEHRGFIDEIHGWNTSLDGAPAFDFQLNLSFSVVVYALKMNLTPEQLVRQAESSMLEVRKEHQAAMESAYNPFESTSTSEIDAADSFIPSQKADPKS